MAKHVGVKLPDDLIRILKLVKQLQFLLLFLKKDCRIQHLFNVFIQKG